MNESNNGDVDADDVESNEAKMKEFLGKKLVVFGKKNTHTSNKIIESHYGFEIVKKAKKKQEIESGSTWLDFRKWFYRNNEKTKKNRNENFLNQKNCHKFFFGWIFIRISRKNIRKKCRF